MKYADCIRDVEIAQKALSDSLLMSAVSGKTLVCEVFCIPPPGHQTFYMQVYKAEKEWILLYAKPIIDNMVTYLSFRNAEKANKSTHKKGDIYCSIKRLPIYDSTISQLIDILPKESEITRAEDFVIDGVTTFIKNHCCEPAAVLFYRNANDISANVYSDEQKKFLDDLYLHIENIIGNLYRTNHEIH